MPDIKSVLTDAERVGRSGFRALIINYPFGAVLASFIVGQVLGWWLGI